MCDDGAMSENYDGTADDVTIPDDVAAASRERLDAASAAYGPWPRFLTALALELPPSVHEDVLRRLSDPHELRDLIQRLPHSVRQEVIAPLIPPTPPAGEWHRVQWDEYGRPTSDTVLPDPDRTVRVVRIHSYAESVGVAGRDMDGRFVIQSNPSQMDASRSVSTPPRISFMWRYET